MSLACVSLAWPGGWDVAVHEELPSTQDVALQAARAGGADRTAILARRQTAGRGRRGQVWQAPAGNLNLSVLLRPGSGICPLGMWPLLAGLAVHDAVGAVLPAPAGLMLKWPNDVLLHNAKLAGILIDSAIAPDGTWDYVVIGMGVNIQASPAIDGRDTIDLRAAGASTTPEALAAAIAGALDRWRMADMADIRLAWLRRAHEPGTLFSLRIGSPKRTVRGRFAGLAEDGGLILDGFAAPFHAGELHIGALQIAQAEGEAMPCCW